MFLDQVKKDLPSTSDSFYTPSKSKNPSSIETNPSVNAFNNISHLSPSSIKLITPSSHLQSVPSYQYSVVELSQSIPGALYSNIELSESIHPSPPSFMSPNKQIGSVLMTPNYSMSIGTNSPNKIKDRKQRQGQFRLKTESNIGSIKLQTVDYQKDEPVKKVPASQIRQLMNLIQNIRVANYSKQQYTKKKIERIAYNSYLLKKVQEKQQDIYEHKRYVETRIQKKNILRKKLKAKKSKLKQHNTQKIKQLENLVLELQKNCKQTEKKLQRENRKIAELERERMQYLENLKLKNHYTHCMYNPSSSFTFQQPSYSPSRFYFPNPEQFPQQKNTSKHYTANNQVPIDENAIVFSTPTSSQNNPNSQHSNTHLHPTPNQIGLFNILKQNLTNQILQNHSENQPAQNKINNESIPEKIHQALSLKLNQLSKQQIIPKKEQKMNQNVSPIRIHEQTGRQKASVEFKSIGNISPINNDNSYRLNKFLQKKDGSQKRGIQQMIESFSDREESPRPRTQNRGKSDDNQSEIAIDCESIENFSEYKSRESQVFSARNKQSNTEQKSPRLKKSIINTERKRGSLKEMTQSSVNIDLQSYGYPQKIYTNYEIVSPQTNLKQILTVQESHVIKSLPQGLEQRSGSIKGSKLKESYNKSGEETPGFGSQNASSDRQLKFSQPFLGQLKKSTNQQGNIGYSQTFEQRQIAQDQNNKKQKKNQGQSEKKGFYRIENLLNSSNPFKTIQNQQQMPKDIQDEDDLFDCALDLQSKVLVKNEEASSSLPSEEQNKLSAVKFQDGQFEDMFEEIRNSNSSLIQSPTKTAKKTSIPRQKRGSADSIIKTKMSYQFEIVPQEDEALEEDKSSLLHKKLKSKPNSKITL